MPQLDPAPWFSLLFLSWLTLLIFIPPKVLAHTFPNEPLVISAESTKKAPWNWKW